MGIIIFAIVCVAAVIGIAVAAMAVSAKVLKEPEVQDDTRQKETLSEWNSLSKRHDPAKANADVMASSEAYQTLDAIRAELEASLPGSMKLNVRLRDEASFRDYDPHKDFWPETDASEQESYLEWSRRRGAACWDVREKLDLGCAMGAMSGSDTEKALCEEMAERIYSLLDTGLEIRLEAPADDGVHTLKKTIRIEADEIAERAGAEPERAAADMLARYRILKAHGFRCSLCGRSPVSGVKLHAAPDRLTGEDTCLCDGCRKN